MRNVSDADEYRRQAENARKMADRTARTEDKAFWLRMAEDWAKLALTADERRKGRQGQGPENSS